MNVFPDGAFPDGAPGAPPRQRDAVIATCKPMTGEKGATVTEESQADASVVVVGCDGSGHGRRALAWAAVTWELRGSASSEWTWTSARTTPPFSAPLKRITASLGTGMQADPRTMSVKAAR